jgi:hypothetical protein
MRYLVVALLIGADALVIYFGGAEKGFPATFITVILIGLWLAFSYSREGMTGEPRDPEDPDFHEGDDMVHRSRARPP